MAETVVQELVINTLTQAQFDAAKEAGTLSPYELYGTPDALADLKNNDGSLTWDGKKVLVNSTANNGNIKLLTDTVSTGAALILTGSESGGDGYFELRANYHDGTGGCTLQGYSDGVLSWNGVRVSAIGMPSGTYTDLTPPANGVSAPFTAPADGWFFFRGTSTGSNQRLRMRNSWLVGAHFYSSATGQELWAAVPVKLGDKLTIEHTLGGECDLRFTYAEGAKHLA